MAGLGTVKLVVVAECFFRIRDPKRKRKLSANWTRQNVWELLQTGMVHIVPIHTTLLQWGANVMPQTVASPRRWVCVPAVRDESERGRGWKGEEEHVCDNSCHKWAGVDHLIFIARRIAGRCTMTARCCHLLTVLSTSSRSPTTIHRAGILAGTRLRVNRIRSSTRS